MRNLMEKKIWFIDTILTLYFIYLTIFSKPYWCTVRKHLMTEDCSEDIYGNDYHIWSLFPFISSGTFLLSTFIMMYFNIKFYIIHKNLRNNIHMLKSTRKTKLALISILNVLHFLFYFLAKDNIITIDACSIIKFIFLFMIMLAN